MTVTRIGVLATTLSVACSGPADRADIPPARLDRGTHVVLLGTGNPNANPERSGPATAVVVDGHAYLVDAGPGIVRRAAAAATRYNLDALLARNLDIVFITHLHSDHTLGLPALIFSPWVLDRDVPLRVYGPPGIVDMTDHLEAAWRLDVRNRIDGLQPTNPDGYKVDVHEIAPGEVYADRRVRVTAIPVPHGSWDHAFGYRFDTADRRIVISGDATPAESLVEACNGCDLLVHEVYSEAGWQQRSPEWQRYHAYAHTSSVALGRLAAEARPGLLVLYHQLAMGSTPEEIEAEVRAGGYRGPIAYGNDLDVY